MIPAIDRIVLVLGSSLSASIVAKATVIAASGRVGGWLMRGKRGREALLPGSGAFGALLLLPAVSMLAPAVRIPWAVGGVTDVAPPPTGSISIPSLTPMRTDAAVPPAKPRSLRLSPSAIVLIGWLAGAALFLIPVLWGLRTMRAMRRSGVPWREGQAVADKLALDPGIQRRVEVLLHEALPGPITSGLLRPAIILPSDVEAWEREDLNRALVHELEHVDRGDAICQCLARIVCSFYWFHPIVWALWRQLVLEAQRSCDDAVIARSEATAYADQLVRLARRLRAAPKSPLLAMATRSDLPIRVGAVLDGNQRRGRAGSRLVALSGCAAALLALVMAPLSSRVGRLGSIPTNMTLTHR